MKIDVLAQGGLAAMRDVKASLAKRSVTVDLNALEPWQDPQVSGRQGCPAFPSCQHLGVF
ncbi:MAG: hypothetical protein ABSC01_13330 [Verrucomicrobiota bacterium]